MIGVLLVEDHASFADALAGMMGYEADMAVVAAAHSGESALQVLDAEDGQEVDVAIVDLDLPGMPGIDVLAELRGRHGGIGLVVLTATSDPVDLGRAVEAGANAVLHKATPMATVFDTVRRVVGARSALDPDDVTRWLLALSSDRESRWEQRLARDLLSPRELEVLRLLAQGRSSTAIATALTVAEATVHTHIRNLRSKLGVATRLEAVAEAHRLDLLDPSP